MSTEVTEPVETDETVEIKDPKAVLEALERAKKDAKTYREQVEALSAQLEESKTAFESLKEEKDGITSAWSNELLEMHIDSELSKRGLSSQAERVRKYLSREGLSLGDDKKPVGLEEAFGTLEKDFPEIFDVKRRVGGGADQFNTPEPKVTLSTTEQQLKRLQHNN